MAEASALWTDERVERLRQLWREGLSASQIAAELGGGMTRNAVLGKVHRLGLERSASAASSPSRRRKECRLASRSLLAESSADRGAPQANKPQSPPPAVQRGAGSSPEVEAQPPQQGRTIMELREGMCRWPLGDPTTPEFRFCGGHAPTGAPYCSHHAQIAYQPIIQRKRLRA